VELNGGSQDLIRFSPNFEPKAFFGPGAKRPCVSSRAVTDWRSRTPFFTVYCTQYAVGGSYIPCIHHPFAILCTFVALLGANSTFSTFSTGLGGSPAAHQRMRQGRKQKLCKTSAQRGGAAPLNFSKEDDALFPGDGTGEKHRSMPSRLHPPFLTSHQHQRVDPIPEQCSYVVSPRCPGHCPPRYRDEDERARHLGAEPYPDLSLT
jgi:hypothetical protein